MNAVARLALAALAVLPQSAEELPRRRDALSARIEAIRGEKFRSPVAIDIGTRKEGASVALDSAKELYGGDLAGFERVLKSLGLIPSALKLNLAIPTFAGASMKSYVHDGKLKVLDPGLPDDELVYRLTVVLSNRRLPVFSGLSFDGRMTRLAVMHGDADMTKQLFWAGLNVNGTRTDVATHVKRLTEGADKWERETSGFAGLVAPRFLVRSSDFMWRRGGIFMETMRQSGGIGRLRYVYAWPPTTTEQILHPEKYLSGEGRSVVSVEAVARLMETRKRDVVFRTELGELGTALLLESIEPKTKREASEGWSGDTLLAWEEGDRTAMVWSTTWDSERDAQEFEDAAAAAGFILNAKDESAKAFVIRKGISAAFVVNCPDTLKKDLADAMWK